MINAPTDVKTINVADTSKINIPASIDRWTITGAYRLITTIAVISTVNGIRPVVAVDKSAGLSANPVIKTKTIAIKTIPIPPRSKIEWII